MSVVQSSWKDFSTQVDAKIEAGSLSSIEASASEGGGGMAQINLPKSYGRE